MAFEPKSIVRPQSNGNSNSNSSNNNKHDNSTSTSTSTSTSNSTEVDRATSVKAGSPREAGSRAARHRNHLGGRLPRLLGSTPNLPTSTKIIPKIP